MEFTHDCSRHHLQIQSDINAPFSFSQRSYDANVLQRSIFDISGREPTRRQEYLRYGFLSDYLLADTDKMTVKEITDFHDAVFAFLDEYFYRGGLTKGERRLVRIEVYDIAAGMSEADTQQPIPNLSSAIFVYLRSRATGKRRSKMNLLDTIIHESVHAYLTHFFNFCPINDNNKAFYGPAHDGHGILWATIYVALVYEMRMWHPSLAAMDPNVGHIIPLEAPLWFDPLYYEIVAKLPWLRREWDVKNLGPREPTGIFRSWNWRPGHKEEFKKALLELTYNDYNHFVELRVPPSENVYFRIFRPLVAALFATCLLAAVLFVFQLYKRLRFLVPPIPLKPIY